ncbi:hypothetical protein ACFL1N_02035 [Thermodesulfobacteriota bacterium]
MKKLIWPIVRKIEYYSGKSSLTNFLNYITARNITVAGMECTGSTFVYQIIKEIGASPIKIHHYLEDNTIKLVTYRDPRDVICSYARRQLKDISESHGLENGLLNSHRKLFCNLKRHEDLRQYRENNHAILLKYEKYFNGHEIELISYLSDRLKIKINASKKNLLTDKYSIDMNMKRSKHFMRFQEYDEETQIHGDHISSGGRKGVWKELFTPKVCEIVKKDLGNFLIEFGYENNMDWQTQ